MASLAIRVRTNGSVESWDVLGRQVNMPLLSVPPNADLHVDGLSGPAGLWHSALLHSNNPEYTSQLAIV